MSPIGRKLVQMMDQEQKNMKLTALEDVMRAVRLLAGWGQYPQFISNPWEVFCKYNDMNIIELYDEQDALTRMANDYVQSIHPPATITRILRDDEQDFED